MLIIFHGGTRRLQRLFCFCYCEFLLEREQPKNIHQQDFFPPEIAEMEQARALFDQGVTVARGWGHSIDLWVAKNVSKQNQTYLMFGLIVCMVLHLVYTKRKVQREVKEEQMLAKQNKKKN